MNSQIDEKVEAFASRSAIPQLNIGIWHNGAQYEASYGSDQHSAVDVFEIGSIGKTFTATLLAVLAENGVVRLDDTVGKFRPDLAFANDITLLQLATHTSGLPNNPFKGIILDGGKALRNFSAADYKQFLEGIHKPGKTGKFRYSNLGMALLGNVLADQLGSSYENAVRTHILNALGMTDTHVAAGAYDIHRLAIGHGRNGKAVPAFHWSCMEPAGVWRSTSKDMMTYLQAHLGYSGASWKSLLGKTTLPAFKQTKLEHAGLAWQLSSNKELGDCAWHNGQTLGQKSVAVCAKASDSAVIILSNRIPRLWQHFFVSYSIEQLAFDILESLSKSSNANIESTRQGK